MVPDLNRTDAGLDLSRYDESSDALFEQLQATIAARPSDALRVACALERRAERAGNAVGVIRALLIQGAAHNALGQAERDLVFARALDLAEREAEPVTLVRAASSQIFVDIYNARYADALWRGQSILGVAHALGRSDLLVRLIINLGTAFSLVGEFGLAITMFNECLVLIEGDSDPAGQQRQRTINNIAWSWRGLSRVLADEGDPAAAARALASARSFAMEACEGALQQPNAELRAGSLDTLVGVLVEMGQVDEALRWVARVTEQSADLLVPGSVAWGIHALAQSRAELARSDCELNAVVQRLRAIEALPGSAFRGGELGATLNRCLSDALARIGEFREALACHRRWLQFEARAQSLLAREHAMAVHRTLESLRGETEEFITHDLRNPLGAALVQMDAALVGSLPSGKRAQVERARGHVQQAFDTAERYLVVLRTRHLRRADLKPIDLAELLDDVGERLAPPAGAPVRLERELEWGWQVRGDRIALLMAVHDLLSEALRHAPGGSVVRCRLSVRAGLAVLSVHAAGMCWAEALQARLRQSVGAGAGGRRDMGALMLMRVAQLHDVSIGVVGGQALEWHFPILVDPEG